MTTATAANAHRHLIIALLVVVVHAADDGGLGGRGRGRLRGEGGGVRQAPATPPRRRPEAKLALLLHSLRGRGRPLPHYAQRIRRQRGRANQRVLSNAPGGDGPSASLHPFGGPGRRAQAEQRKPTGTHDQRGVGDSGAFQGQPSSWVLLRRSGEGGCGLLLGVAVMMVEMMLLIHRFGFGGGAGKGQASLCAV